MEKILSVSDIAEMLGVCEETVRRWIRDGKLRSSIQCRKFGNAIIMDDLIDFVYGDQKTLGKYQSHLSEFLNHIQY